MNKKVKSNVDIPYYFKKGETYQLEDVYDGGVFLQYKVRGERKLSEYFPSTYFEVIK